MSSIIYPPVHRPAQKKQEFDELSKEVENFSSRLEAKVKAVVNEITARLTADFEKNEALLKANRVKTFDTPIPPSIQ